MPESTVAEIPPAQKLVEDHVARIRREHPVPAAPGSEQREAPRVSSVSSDRAADEEMERIAQQAALRRLAQEEAEKEGMFEEEAALLAEAQAPRGTWSFKGVFMKLGNFLLSLVGFGRKKQKKTG